MKGTNVSLRVAVVAICLCAALVGTTVGIAAAAGGTQDSGAKEELPEVKVDGSFAPKLLPRRGQAPIRLGTGIAIRQPDAFEGHPVAVREIEIESAQLEVHTRGIPVCRAGQLQTTEARMAERACGPAMIGAGSAIAQVAFVEQKPIDVKARLLVFNGGTEDGKTTLYLHTYFSNPISGAIITTVTVTHLDGAHFGTLAIAKVPQITGGSGSIIRFHFTIDRNVAGHHPISATCERGKVRAFVEGKFEDGTKATSEIVRPCKPVGSSSQSRRYAPGNRTYRVETRHVANR